MTGKISLSLSQSLLIGWPNNLIGLHRLAVEDELTVVAFKVGSFERDEDEYDDVDDEVDEQDEKSKDNPLSRAVSDWRMSSDNDFEVDLDELRRNGQLIVLFRFFFVDRVLES